MEAINHSAVWAKLHQHQRTTRHIHMRDLFAAEENRFQLMHTQLNGMLLDYSKNRITEETLDLLIELANTARLHEQTEQMFQAALINSSEHRAVLHTAMRLPEKSALDAHNQMAGEALDERDRALAFAESLYRGQYLGVDGQPISDIVHIGIGGSDLGPRMVYQALTPYCNPHIAVHFVANVDAADLAETLAKLSAKRTLFIVASKSFTTPETLINARNAKQWLIEQLSEQAVAQHFVAISSNIQAALDFGIAQAHIFAMCDWVGGRYSVTSTIGLPVMCAIGSEHFRAFLAGAHQMDNHFRHAPYRQNMPVLMALIGIWYNTFYRAHSHAIIPYHHGLRRLPAHIQQLDMESNGKHTSRDGDYLDFDTGPIIWGEEGVNCQHAFFQLLHQGTRLIPADFIVVAHNAHADKTSQAVLVANALAQTRALMQGKKHAEVYRELSHLDAIERDCLLPQKCFPGNQPSNTIFIDALNPYNMGMLLALYEHKVFVQGAIWGINSFDQWGVEYGKILAKQIEPILNNSAIAPFDSSTNGLIDFFRHFG